MADFNEVRRLREQGVPDPDGTALGNLRHTLAVYLDAEDSRVVVEATGHIYPQWERTGLTFGDLRALMAELEAEES